MDWTLEVVQVPVTDVDRAKTFYAEQVADVGAARAQLVGRGVDVSEVRHYDGAELVDGPGGDWNSFIFFDDPDGNGWVVQERPIHRQGG